MSRSLLAALLWLQVQFGALRALERLPDPWSGVAVSGVWVASAAGAWLLVQRAPRWPLLRTPWPVAGLLVAAMACALVVYPEVDGRRSTGGGSDADDAVVLVADRVRSGEDPFAADTYLGNPPTTGPGSVLWALPFPGRRAYAAAVVPALAAALLILRRRTGGWDAPSLAAVVIGASVPFWEGVAQGTDHLAMAAGLVVLTAAVPSDAARPSAAVAVAVATLAGVLATWRAAYLHLPVLVAAAWWPRSRRGAAIVAAGGLLLAVALHGVLLSWTDGGWDAYDPVQQLFVKSDDDLSPGGRAMLVAGVLAATGAVLAEWRRPRPRAEVLVLAGIGGPMATIAVAGLLTADDPAAWSEASYLLPTLLLAAVVAARPRVGSPTA